MWVRGHNASCRSRRALGGRRLLVAPIDRDEAPQPKGPCQEWNAIDFCLVQDVHLRMQRVEEHGRIDVALVVRAVHGGAAGRDVLGALNAKLDAREAETKGDATVAKKVEQVFPLKQDGQHHPNRGGDEDVNRNNQVGGEGSDGGAARLSVILRDIPGALGIMSSILGARHANIVNLSLVHRDGSFQTFHLDIEVHDLAHLHGIIAALRDAEPVSSVERI